MQTELDILLALWGKTDRKDRAIIPKYHPLLFHLLDVGNAGRMIWRFCIAPVIKRRAELALGLSSSETEELVAVMCALHDIGKAAPGFQSKSDGLRVEAGLSLPTVLRNKPHGLTSARIIAQAVPTGACGILAHDDVADAIGRVLGAHHGVFPRSKQMVFDWGKDVLGDQDWETARALLFAAVNQALRGTQDSISVSAEQPTDPGTFLILAGLVSVADWVGSSEPHFPFAGRTISPDAYALLSSDRANAALNKLRWLPRPRFAGESSFENVFTSISPNSMQAHVAKLASTTERPYLMVVEDAMGRGKTEAALFAIDCCLTKGVSPGFYFALPTQATGNAMYRRVRADYLEKRGHGGGLNLQLVHGNLLAAEMLTAATIYDDSGGVGAGTVSAEAWFTPRKQALLAPFGVGTIDQALMAVLQTKHWFVRMFGLAGKVVVFDEVHSFDVYMNEIFHRLLTWLAQLGCTVILLSATLPKSKRTALFEAYAKGAGWSAHPIPACRYPRVTFVGEEGEVSVRYVGEADERTRNVNVGFTSPDERALAELSFAKLASGGYAAVICNTVDRAQDVFRALKLAAKEKGLVDCEILLLHAQMPQCWRQSREEMLLDWCGRNSEREAGIRIVVGTSLLEQSIDYDVDWMVSEVAPVDLLLQRLGRLHRHQRAKRAIEAAEFLIVCDFDANAHPQIPEVTAQIYDKYILLRTCLALGEKNGRLSLPSDIDDLVQKVYDGEMTAPNGWWKDNLHSARLKTEAKRKIRKAKARRILVNEPMDPSDAVEQYNDQLRDDDDPEVVQQFRALTRDGDPSITVVCAGTDLTGASLAQVDFVSGTKEQVSALLQFAVPLSSKQLYHPLVGLPVPHGWDKQPALRYCRQVIFQNGHAYIGANRTHVKISQELGLEIERTRTG